MLLMANVWQDAFSSTYPQWEAVIRHVGWRSMLAAAGYALEGALCWATGVATRHDGGSGAAWFLAAGVLAVIGANTLVRVDLLAIFLLREVARAQGWYEQRRDAQLLVLVALATAGMLALGWLRIRLHAVWSRCATVVLGVGILAGVAALRAVSHHVTDLAFDVHLLGVSAGRLLELAGLGLTAVGILRWSRSN
jgi:hypothetical protein